jgi:hypothetical protein
MIHAMDYVRDHVLSAITCALLMLAAVGLVTWLSWERWLVQHLPGRQRRINDRRIDRFAAHYAPRISPDDLTVILTHYGRPGHFTATRDLTAGTWRVEVRIPVQEAHATAQPYLPAIARYALDHGPRLVIDVWKPRPTDCTSAEYQRALEAWHRAEAWRVEQLVTAVLNHRLPLTGGVVVPV